MFQFNPNLYLKRLPSRSIPISVPFYQRKTSTKLSHRIHTPTRKENSLTNSKPSHLISIFSYLFLKSPSHSQRIRFLCLVVHRYSHVLVGGLPTAILSPARRRHHWPLSSSNYHPYRRPVKLTKGWEQICPVRQFPCGNLHSNFRRLYHITRILILFARSQYHYCHPTFMLNCW